MVRTLIAIAVVVAVIALPAGARLKVVPTPIPTPPVQTPVGYSRAVTQICAGALLFEGRHQIGTRTGAIAVSRDIRATGDRRLHRVDAVSKVAGTAKLAARWIAIERHLVQAYASTYLQIWYAIDNARSPHEHASLPALLRILIAGPDRLQGQAAKLARRLYVPDCTGGAPSGLHTGEPDRSGPTE